MNHPINPRIIIGTDIAKSKDANNPAVVPPMTLTSAKIMMAVSAPITPGNKMVKSYSSMLPPKIWYVVAAVTCNITCEVAETSRPLGYQLLVSCQS